MRRCFFLLFLLALPLPPAGAEPDWNPLASRPAVASVFRQGQQKFQAGDVDGAETLFSSALEKAQGDGYATATLLTAIGGVYHDAGQYAKASDYFTRALPAWEGRDDPAEALVKQDSLSQIYEELHQYDKAVEARAAAFPLFQAGGYAYQAANDLQLMGGDYHSLGQDDKGLEYSEQAGTLWKKRGDLGRLNAALLNAGVCATSLGQYDKALDLLNRVEATRQDNPGAYLDCLYSLGRVYHLMGQLDKAISYYSRSRDLYLEKFDKIGIAKTTMSLGAAYCNAHDYARAEELLNSALAMSILVGTQRVTAGCSLGLGLTCWYQADYAGAATNFQRSLTWGRQSSDQITLALSEIGLGLTEGQLGKPDQGLTLVQQALPIIQSLDNNTFLALADTALGSLYEQSGQGEQAFAADQKGLEAVEAATFQLNDPTDVGALLDMLPHPYGRAAAVRLAQGQASEALTLVERGRGQGLARQAAVAHLDFSRLLSADDALALKAREDERNAARSLLRAAHSLAAQARADEAERQYGLTRDLLFARYPQFKRLQAIQPPSADDLRALASHNPNTLFLEWSLVDDKRTLLFALSQKDGIQGWTLPTGEKRLTRLAESWRSAIQAGDASEPQSGEALYAALFAPLQNAGLLTPGRYARLVIVADGPLLNVPFAALVSDSSHRLLDHYALSYAVSLGVLTWTRPVTRPAKTLLCIADPLGDKKPGAPVQMAARLRGEILSPLPYARSEARAVAGLIPGSVLIVGKVAREADIKAQIGQYGLLHFATHGLLDTGSPLRSGLVMAPEPAGSAEDGLLDAGEILSLPLTARLAVLSACRTAEGKSGGGEGLMGLSWAFQAAGCPSVVASQWSVSDQATARLMTVFYQGLAQGRRRDESLRRAMQSVRALPHDSAPQYWAAFTLIGDAGTLTP